MLQYSHLRRKLCKIPGIFGRHSPDHFSTQMNVQFSGEGGSIPPCRSVPHDTDRKTYCGIRIVASTSDCGLKFRNLLFCWARRRSARPQYSAAVAVLDNIHACACQGGQWATPRTGPPGDSSLPSPPGSGLPEHAAHPPGRNASLLEECRLKQGRREHVLQAVHMDPELAKEVLLAEDEGRWKEDSSFWC